VTPPLVQGKRYLAYFLSSSASSESDASSSLVSTSELSVTINAYDIASNQTHEYEVLTEDMIEVTDQYNGNMIHKMAAQLMINDLEDGGSKLHPDNGTPVNEEEVVNRIVEIGVKYQLASSQTSFIAVDDYDSTTTQDPMSSSVNRISKNIRVKCAKGAKSDKGFKSKVIKSKTIKSKTIKSGCIKASARSAVFVMTNAASGNEIIMYARNKRKGKLKFTGSPFSTGGVGGDSTLEAPPNDPLASQNSLVVACNCLLAVNAGSNTLTSFQILVKDLHRVSIVGSGGDIPVSVTYSSANRLVYALNSGGPGSISGFILNEECVLEPIPMSIVSLNQGPRNLSPPSDGSPPFFVSSPAQIGFTPNSQQLLVTIKGIDGNSLYGGTINHFDVDGTTGLVSNLRIFPNGNNIIVPFSFDFDGDDNMLIFDAFGTGSASLYNFEGTGNTVSLVDNTTIDQTAARSIKYSNGCAFTTNNGASSISSLSVSNGNIALINGTAAELNNPVDEIFSPDGQYIYALSTCHISDQQPRVYVYSVSDDCGLSEVQVISDGLPTEFVTVFGAVGLAVF